MKISKYITYKEATRSNTAKRYGISNHPSSSVLEKMKVTGKKVFDPVREHFGVPMFVSSFFRSWGLNKKLGGSKNSQHPRGEAIDIDDVLSGDEGPSNSEIFYFIKDNLEFDQLIWEFGDDEEPNWVHVSYKEGNNRGIVLRAVKKKNWYGKNYTSYEIF